MADQNSQDQKVMTETEEAELSGVIKVSAIIATRNGSRRIFEALASLLAGNVVPDEIVVLDQSDDERTKNKVDKARGLPGGERIRYVYSTRLGICAHRNDAIAAARGEFIASIDDDVAVTNDWLELMLREWIENCALVGAQRGAPRSHSRLYAQPRPAGPGTRPINSLSTIIFH